MIITMDMSSFEVDLYDQDVENDEEISRSGWNSASEMMVSEQLEHVTPDDSDTDSFAMTQPSSHEGVADVISDIVRRKTYSYRH